MTCCREPGETTATANVPGPVLPAARCVCKGLGLFCLYRRLGTGEPDTKDRKWPLDFTVLRAMTSDHGDSSGGPREPESLGSSCFRRQCPHILAHGKGKCGATSLHHPGFQEPKSSQKEKCQAPGQAPSCFQASSFTNFACVGSQVRVC